MSVNIEQMKNKLMENLPDILPKAVKTIIVHIIMLIYHISMPPWVTAIKIRKATKDFKGDSIGDKNTEHIGRRSSRRRRRRDRQYYT